MRLRPSGNGPGTIATIAFLAVYAGLVVMMLVLLVRGFADIARAGG
jgi:hypothetical protein